jgi:hypothetical protein
MKRNAVARKYFSIKFNKIDKKSGQLPASCQYREKFFTTGRLPVYTGRLPAMSGELAGLLKYKNVKCDRTKIEKC